MDMQAIQTFLTTTAIDVGIKIVAAIAFWAIGSWIISQVISVMQALMKLWRLPALLVRITDNHSEQMTSQVRNVLLAIRVARHSAHGWHNAALPDDVREIADLLQMSSEATTLLLQEIDSE